MSHKGKSLHCAGGHVRMSEDHPASVHIKSDALGMPWPLCRYAAMGHGLDAHFTENPTKFIEIHQT